MAVSDNGKMIAYCGLICSECPAFIATKAGDSEKIASTAAEWSKQFGVNITPENVWCDGCLVGGRKCGHCGECEIRSCAAGKKAVNCGVCAEYESCGKIRNFFNMAPGAKEVLDGIHASS
jgi:hypothetical protein